MQTTMWRDELKSTARIRTGDRSALVEKLRDSKTKLAKRLRSMGLESKWEAKRTASRTLDDTYYSRWLANTYPVVDLSFATGTLDLIVRRTLSGADVVGACSRDLDEPFEKCVNVKRFAIQEETTRGTSLWKDFPGSTVEIGRFTFSSFQRDREKYRDFSGIVHCNRPEGSPKNLKRKLRDVAAILIEAEAAAIRAGVGIDRANPTRALLWMPRVEDMYVREAIAVRDDPAVLVKLGDHAHLIAFWDSPEESPIEGVLREFSEGTLGNVAE